MKSFRIREAVHSDAEDILALHIQSIKEICSKCYNEDDIEAWTREKTPDGYIRAMEQSEAMYVVEDLANNSLAGFGSMSIDDCAIKAVYLSPLYIGKGLGKKILHHLENLAKESGISKLKLNATLNSEGFYSHHGYQFVEKTSHTFSNGHQVDCILMVKVL